MATNDYYNHTAGTFSKGTKARSEAVESEYQKIETGLDKLPTEIEANSGTRNYRTNTGPANAYAASISHISLGYVTGQEVEILIDAADINTTASSTLSISGISIIPIKYPDGGDVAIGDLVGTCLFRYSGSVWHFLGTSVVSAANSAASAAESAASLTDFETRYLGAFASDPTVDNDGLALIAGALYWNTTTDIMMVRTATPSWVTQSSTLGSLTSLTVNAPLTDAGSASDPDVSISPATTIAAGSMSADDKAKADDTTATAVELNDLDRSANLETTVAAALYGSITAGSPTYSGSPEIRYSRIGNFVFGVILINITNKGGMAGDIRISGFPFSSAIYVSVSLSSGKGFTGLTSSDYVALELNGSDFSLIKGSLIGTGAVGASITDVDIDDSTIIVSSFYAVVQ